ncbi:MAG TPA: hypothetical protein VM118_06875, partial [Acidobacteriota bacterium]|nr:hypothetical protein [Acidobacteriota bacterium]
NMDNAEVDDTVTDGTWVATVRTVPTGAAAGTFELDLLAGPGLPTTGDTLTLGGVETCTIVTAVMQLTGDNATDWEIASGEENRSTEIDLYWDA